MLAFSGGLDTSVALVWLQERYGCPVTAMIADLGQGKEVETARRKAFELGAADVVALDLQEEFARDFAFPMYRADALYEGQYLMGSSIGRPLIAAAQLRVAEASGRTRWRTARPARATTRFGSTTATPRCVPTSR